MTPETPISITKGLATHFVETSHGNYISCQDSKGWVLTKVDLTLQEYKSGYTFRTFKTNFGAFFGSDFTILNPRN